MEDQQITSETWPNYFNADGQILYEYQVRKCIFFKGIAPEARPQVWPFLLAVYPFSSTPHQRQTIDANNSKEYAKLCEAWQLLRDREDESYRKNRKIIDKDVLRTDRNHPYFTGDDNPNLDTLRNLLLAHTVLDPELGTRVLCCKLNMKRVFHRLCARYERYPVSNFSHCSRRSQVILVFCFIHEAYEK
eukprot:m.88786 g.88786  ORF g.88786 m.88786 type:complete len:189 (+) comp13188_c0_seq3:357-923(+)